MGYFTRMRRAFDTNPAYEHQVRRDAIAAAEEAREDAIRQHLATNIDSFENDLLLRSLGGTPEPPPRRPLAKSESIDLAASSLGCNDVKLSAKAVPVAPITATAVAKIESVNATASFAEICEGLRDDLTQIIKAHQAKALPRRPIQLKARELKDCEATFISLVKRGANRIPFRVMKSDKGTKRLVPVGGTLDLSTIFRR